MRIELNSAIVASDVFSIIILIIICVSVMMEKKRGKRNNAFVFCGLFTIVSLVFEIFNYVLEGDIANTNFLYFTNYGTIVVGDAIIFFFAKYVYECVQDKKKSKDKMMIIFILLCLIDFIIQTVGVLTGTSFVIENATFVAKPLYDSTFVTTVLTLALLKIYIAQNRKYIGKYLYRVFSLYYVFPIVTTVLLLVSPYLSFLLQGVALSLLIVYIGIEKQEKENLLIDLSNKDALTGLFNRTAWNKKLEEINSKREKVRVVFSDLNNLKRTNDVLGHNAGDELINKFTNILKSVFINDEIFRIGGDEFVVVIENNLDNSDDKLGSFKKIVVDNKDIASFGECTGDSSNIVEIIKTAETAMYRDKSEYYKKNSVERRTNRDA